MLGNRHSAEICTVCPLGAGGAGVGDYEEDMTSLVPAHVLQRHQLVREGVCMTGTGRD